MAMKRMFGGAALSRDESEQSAERMVSGILMDLYKRKVAVR